LSQIDDHKAYGAYEAATKVQEVDGDIQIRARRSPDDGATQAISAPPSRRSRASA